MIIGHVEKNKLHSQPANYFSISSINVRQLPVDFPLKMDDNLKKMKHILSARCFESRSETFLLLNNFLNVTQAESVSSLLSSGSWICCRVPH